MNKVKKILIASLVVAMILPFSGMQFATAETDQVLKKIQSAKENAKLATSASTDEIKEHKKLVYRLNLAEEHRKLQLDGKGDSKKANEILSNLKVHFEKYFKNSPPQVLGNSPVTTLTTGVTRSFDTSDIFRTDCSNTTVGDSHGTIAAWETTSYLQGSLVSENDYPSSTTVDCTNKSFDGGYILYYNVFEPWGSCIQNFDSSTYITGDYCAGISTNDLILVEAQAWYQDNIWSAYFSNQWVAL